MSQVDQVLLFDVRNESNSDSDYHSSKSIKITPMFCVLMAAYAGVLLISNIISSKIIMPFGYVLPCAVILFPVVYILSDILTEIYGIKLSMLAIMTNLGLNLFMSVIFGIAIFIPSAPFYENGEAFSIILGNTPRIVLASLAAYWCGDTVNSLSLSYFKAKLQKHSFFNTFFFRSIFSSVLGQIFDTGIFIFIAFFNIVSIETMLMMMLNQYCVKISYEVICYPLIRMTVNWWKKVEKIDVIDNW